MLSCNHFGVSTFTFHLKILFKQFSQQHAGYHLVKQIYGTLLTRHDCHEGEGMRLPDATWIFRSKCLWLILINQPNGWEHVVISLFFLFLLGLLDHQAVRAGSTHLTHASMQQQLLASSTRTRRYVQKLISPRTRMLVLMYACRSAGSTTIV
jgi:hypothetical protein